MIQVQVYPPYWLTRLCYNSYCTSLRISYISASIECFSHLGFYFCLEKEYIYIILPFSFFPNSFIFCKVVSYIKIHRNGIISFLKLCRLLWNQPRKSKTKIWSMLDVYQGLGMGVGSYQRCIDTDSDVFCLLLVSPLRSISSTMWGDFSLLISSAWLLSSHRWRYWCWISRYLLPSFFGVSNLFFLSISESLWIFCSIFLKWIRTLQESSLPLLKYIFSLIYHFTWLSNREVWQLMIPFYFIWLLRSACIIRRVSHLRKHTSEDEDRCQKFLKAMADSIIWVISQWLSIVPLLGNNDFSANMQLIQQ